MKKEFAVMLDGVVFETFGTRDEAVELMAYITMKNRERRKFGGREWAKGKRSLVSRDVSPWHKEKLGGKPVPCSNYFHDGRHGFCGSWAGAPQCNGRALCGKYVAEGVHP